MVYDKSGLHAGAIRPAARTHPGWQPEGCIARSGLAPPLILALSCLDEASPAAAHRRKEE